MVVEDEPLISMMLKEMLDELALGVIGPLDSVAQGLAALQSAGRVDAAILDLELQGSQSVVVADALLKRGIPFAFMTGHEPAVLNGIGYGNVPVLAKPFRMADVATLLNRLLGLFTA